MRITKWILAAAFLIAVPGTYAADAPSVPAARQQIPAVDTTAFAGELYARLASQSQGNLFFSPTSIETALAMTYAGARGHAAVQMARTLHYDNDAAKVCESFAGLLKTLNSPPEIVGRSHESGKPAYQLFVANALWGQQSYPFKPEFIKLVEKKYEAGLSNLDFAGHTEQARTTINDWVAARTKEKIKELIPQGIITPGTRLVLTNAIYFKSNWQHNFEKGLTKDGPFKLSTDKPVDVPLMHQRGSFGYCENDDLQLLEMPYRQGTLSMVVLLPRSVDGLSVVEKKLTAGNLNQWLRDRTSETVEVTFPKFTFTSPYFLNNDLAAMGMTDAFDSAKADFSEMAAEERLFISAVIHKAFVAVDEDGTEAAAATGVVMPGAAAPRSAEPKVFKADHPFLFLIRHNATGEILFLGRLVDPKRGG